MLGTFRSRALAVARRCSDAGVPVALAALIAYCAVASPFIVDGDDAEFATLGAVGGRSHPPGYPLYVLWLRAWSWLPAATPAHRAAFATALLGSAALLVIHAACRAWGIRPLAASIATAVWGAAPLVIRYHSEAEVFALNHLIAALVLWLAASAGPLRGVWRGGALGLVAGLGLANHMTCALLAPIGILGVVRAARESRIRAVALLLAIAGLALGLSPYAYLWIADSPASWGNVSSWRDVVAIILRQEYGGVSGFAPMGTAVPWTENLWLLVQTLGRTWLWLPPVLGLVMLVLRIRRPSEAGEPRWGWIALFLSFLLAGPVLAARFNVRLDDLGRYVCERFYMLPALLLVIPVASAVDHVSERLRRLAAPLPVFVFVIAAATALPYVGRMHSPAMEYGVQNLLRSMPAAAVVYVVPDDLCGGAMYVQIARGERPDVVVLCAAMLSLRWYRAQQSRRSLGVEVVPGGLSGALLKSGRSIFADPQLSSALAAYPHYPYGIVRRVLPAGTPLPGAKDIAEINKGLFDHFELDYAWPGPADGYAALAHYRYAATWSAIARLLETSGDRDGARDAAELSARLGPRN